MTIRMLRRLLLPEKILLGAGDQIRLTYIEINGVVRTERTIEIAKMMPYRSTLVNEALMVEGEVYGRYVMGVLLAEAE